MIPAPQQNFPPPQEPVVDDTKTLTQSWKFLLLALFNRTGKETGTLTTGVIDTTNASQLPFDINLLSQSLAASFCVLFPLQPGEKQEVINQSNNFIGVNAPSGYSVDGGASYNLASGKTQIFTCISQNTIVSLQLG